MQDFYEVFLLCCVATFTQVKYLSASSTTVKELMRQSGYNIPNMLHVFPSASPAVVGR